MRKRQPPSPSSSLPTDPLERCHRRWVNLFYGTVLAFTKWDHDKHHDRLGLSDRIALAWQQADLADYNRDVLDLLPEVMQPNPPDWVLEKSGAFLRSLYPQDAPSLPDLRGRRKGGALRPPWNFAIRSRYSRLLQQEQQKDREARAAGKRARERGGKAPHERALAQVAREYGYTEETAEKLRQTAGRMLPKDERRLKWHEVTE